MEVGRMSTGTSDAFDGFCRRWHKSSRASLQAELARLGLSGRPWFRPDTVTGKRKLKERSGRKNCKILALVRTGLAL